MTDEPTTIAEACDLLAQEQSWHPRIRTALVEGYHDRARHLLVTRMRGMMDGHAEGDSANWGSSNPDRPPARLLRVACEMIDVSPGPLIFRAMREAALREIERVVAAYGYPLEA